MLRATTMRQGMQKGFTLVELSIVLVIIALLVGGVMAGQEVLAGAKLKSVVAQVDKLKAAVGQYKDQYNGLPGDSTTAATDFGASTDCTPPNGIGTGTCNGNGNLQIASETSDEAFAALDQLNLAGLIEGSFDGAWNGGFSTRNVMSTAKDGVYMYVRCCSGTDYSRSISFNNHVVLFDIYSADDDFRAGAFTPIEAFNMDTKSDDGIPDNGFVGGSGGYNGSAYVATGCYSGTGTTSTYDSTGAGKNTVACQMQFAYDWD